MTPKKIERIKNELFGTKQKIMADKLGVSPAKISMAITKNQKLSAEAVGILICDYNIDPFWFFKANDDEPIQFNVAQANPYEKKYAEVLEKQVSLLEEKLESYEGKNANLKKSHNLLDD